MLSMIPESQSVKDGIKRNEFSLKELHNLPAKPSERYLKHRNKKII